MISCEHVWGFNMDEWSDAEGNTLAGDAPGSFQNAMEDAFYDRLEELTVPPEQRYFATRERLEQYPEKIAELRAEGAKLVVVYGIGRALHIAFWEPTFAAEYENEAEWRAATHRIGARLHPLTIEQNAITSFKSRTTLVPAWANTIGPGLFLAAHQPGQVFKPFAGSGLLAGHGRLDGNLDVFDAPLVVVLGLLDSIGNHQIAALACGVEIADGLDAVGAAGDQFAFAQDNSRGVDIFANDDEFFFQPCYFHCFFSLA